MLDALVVGAGISGLALAHRLQQKYPQRQFLVAEARDSVGGNMSSCSADGFLWEEGPNSFTPAPEMLQLAVDVGLRDDLLLADGKLPRYVFWGDRLFPVPMNPVAAATTGLLSPWGKVRGLLGALGFVPPAEIDTDANDETIAQFFRRHLGWEITERLVAPFVSGVYAGDTDALSVESAFARIHRLAEVGGGLVPGALQTAKARRATKKPMPTDLPTIKTGQLCSFVGGLQRLPQAIAAQLGDRVCCNSTLKALKKSDRGTYLAEFSTPDGLLQLESRSVILTTPAHGTAGILRDLAPTASAAIAEIPYPPVASVVLAYPDDAFRQPLDGFGNLIPRHQGIRTLGTIWSSTLFPGRAPEGWALLSNYIGGATDPAIAELSKTEIAAAVHQDLQRTLLAKDIEPKILNVKLWAKAIPQYVLGHRDRLQRLEADLQANPGLYVCTNYLDGVALGDCVRRAQDRADTVEEFLAHADKAPAAAVTT